LCDVITSVWILFALRGSQRKESLPVFATAFFVHAALVFSCFGVFLDPCDGFTGLLLALLKSG
jgi:hypothetical protein